MLSLFRLTIALVVVVVGEAAVVFDNYDPAALPYCQFHGRSCEDIACGDDDDSGNAATTTTTTTTDSGELVGIYRYATTTETEWTRFHQEVLCACHRIREDVTEWVDSRPLRIVADALCRIPRSSVSVPSVDVVETNPTPSCRELGVDEDDEATTGCHEYCNEVVLADIVELLSESDYDSPFYGLGVGSAHGSSTYDPYYCDCRYGNTTLRVCLDPPSFGDDDDEEDEASDGDAPVQPHDEVGTTDSEDDARSGAAAGVVGHRVWFPVATAAVAIAALAAAAEIAGF